MDLTSLNLKHLAIKINTQKTYIVIGIVVVVCRQQACHQIEAQEGKS